jgi:hypothetical protein
MEVKSPTIRCSRYRPSNRVVNIDPRGCRGSPLLKEDTTTTYRFAPGMKSMEAADLALGIRFLLRPFHGQMAQGEIEALLDILDNEG